MNELEVKTLTLEPAIVEFNHEEIERQLEESLKKYSGLVFTEDTATECRSTIAELRKGKRAVDQYRLKIKRELTAPVTAFEDKCKELNRRFDEVINPLVEQHEGFEERRRKEKAERVQEIVNEIINEFGLSDEYSNQIVVQDGFLNKSRSFKSIREELTNQAERLQLEQQKKDADTQVIKSRVELANERYNVNLSDSAYVRLLEFKDVSDIKKQILSDGQKEAEKRVEEEKKKEVERLKQESDQSEPDILVDYFDGEPEKAATPKQKQINDPFSDPFANPKVDINYKVAGTADQINELEKYMQNMGLDWEVLRSVNV